MAVPVPIELIIERHGIDIVPLPSLRRNFDIDGITSCDLTRIYVDDQIEYIHENRYRFTLAHELGHVVLHADLFREYCDAAVGLDDWFELHRSMGEASGGSIEYHANYFAGFVLVPTESLKTSFDGAAAEVIQLVKAAMSQGARRDAALGFAWDTLCSRLAQTFQVSQKVIERRLTTEGYTSSDLDSRWA
ncbi:MAG: ImmA/IrrE family metallo-endopeptidase [Planctomycetes bacterium]|nr:ImmA/IrrE family metallo-endopeptidase [Planctomycetota bacterium]